MGKDLGASSGSREPSPDGLGPSGFDPARCSHLTHSPKGICVLCREQHQPLGGYSDVELAALEADFWADWSAV